ncbi:MAG: hypothetical protein M0Z41_00325, partial [Peptococcaceae bacterium]|nr:hypothetical protein [Peptococcaceae bacterium]
CKASVCLKTRKGATRKHESAYYALKTAIFPEGTPFFPWASDPNGPAAKPKSVKITAPLGLCRLKSLAKHLSIKELRDLLDSTHQEFPPT